MFCSHAAIDGPTSATINQIRQQKRCGASVHVHPIEAPGLIAVIPIFLARSASLSRHANAPEESEGADGAVHKLWIFVPSQWDTT